MRAVLASLVLLSAASARANDPPPLGVFAEPGSTTFRVWAPNARSVAIIGDFNNWKPSRGEHLTRDESTGIWSLDLKRSRPRGAYQFLINDELRRRDPRARAVTPEPEGRASLFYDPAGFSWENDQAPAPALDELVIYEMHIGSFHDPQPGDNMPGTFDDAIDKLDHLAQLGVNTLCLLPVHAYAGNSSWGYNPSDLFAVEQAYGGPDGLKRFVKAAHTRGLTVHLDIVHNHYGPHNLDLVQFDGAGNPRNGGIYFYEGEGIGLTPWGPRVNFDEPMVRRFVRDNAIMWLEEYRIDGFRWDSTINIRAWNNGAVPIPAGAQMLDDINREIKQRWPGRWSIAEDSLHTGHFDASWDYGFHNHVMPQLAATDDARRISVIAGALAESGAMPRVIYIDNHDEAGRLNNMKRIASDVDPANPGSDRARMISGLGAVLTFTAPGIPLLFMGNEFLEQGDWHDTTPLDWGKVTRQATTLALHRDLIRLRRNIDGHTSALRGRRIEIKVKDDAAKQLVYWRAAAGNPDDIVVIAMNLLGQPADMLIPFPSGGPWRLRLNSDWGRYGGSQRNEAVEPFSFGASSGQAKVRMAPWSARIFSLVNRPPLPDSTRPWDSHYTPEEAGFFSLYAAIHVSGNFNQWEKTAWPLRLVGDHQWEGQFAFRQITDPEFNLSANDNGVIFWGGHAPRASSMQTPFNDTIKRLGSHFKALGVWDGLYVFRFNEETLQLEIARLGDVPAGPEPGPAPPAGEVESFRLWTSVRGGTVEAMLIEITGAGVTLENRQGQRVTRPLEFFAESDRAYLAGRAPK